MTLVWGQLELYIARLEGRKAGARSLEQQIRKTLGVWRRGDILGERHQSETHYISSIFRLIMKFLQPAHNFVAPLQPCDKHTFWSFVRAHMHQTCIILLYFIQWAVWGRRRPGQRGHKVLVEGAKEGNLEGNNHTSICFFFFIGFGMKEGSKIRTVRYIKLLGLPPRLAPSNRYL